MDVARYCLCCFSPDSLKILSGSELDVYLLICNTQGLKDDHNQIVACPRCREFLKDVLHFRIERLGVDKIINNNIDVKPYEVQLISRNTTDDNLSQMGIKAEIIGECNETKSKHQGSVDPINSNLLIELHDKRNEKFSELYQRANSDETALDCQRPFSCKICNRSYTLRRNLTAHISTHLNDKDKPHKCSECSYATTTKCSLKAHIASKHSDEKPFSCNMCDYRCKRKWQLPVHAKSHMNGNEKPFKCKECPYTTIHKGNLKDHIAYKHNDEKRFACDMCDYRCKRKQGLSLHIKGHMNDNEKPHKCSECSYTTVTICNLKAHIVCKHSDVKPFSCDTCDYRCANKYQLSLHNLSHLSDDKKPYKCSECSFTTITKCYLTRHVAWKHSSEKPFSCNMCGYRCKRKDLLSIHMRGHLNDSEKPHKCSECSFTTITKGNLKRHIAYKHSDEKPFSCDMCDYRSKRKQRLLVHIKKHLNEKL